ncbi:uncharacterized protein TRUGW13939_01544 [Talaromyces rugulosus]|uniref:Uncharacterized protein n=1 Tax=Talaromyces rugulosus TaxID=121627 RepID=A0A7H8QKQ8_TALRU|nr:uncharacterized protein TRUGW13939_01544 [Talaromyces rugulosus]QKX54458.1 hypothetical protein TRUGW13939_01544 [Talaromyces rugulosus]
MAESRDTKIMDDPSLDDTKNANLDISKEDEKNEKQTVEISAKEYKELLAAKRYQDEVEEGKPRKKPKHDDAHLSLAARAYL